MQRGKKIDVRKRKARKIYINGSARDLIKVLVYTV